MTTTGDGNGRLDSGRRDRDVGTVRASRRRALARQKEAAHAAWLEAIRSERVAYLRYAAAEEAFDREAEARDQGLDGLYPQQARQEAQMIVEGLPPAVAAQRAAIAAELRARRR